MLFYNRILECNICHFYFFEDAKVQYQPYVCNGCHNASLRTISLTDFKIILVKDNTYRVVSKLSYNESFLLLESSGLNGKFGSL